MSRRSLITAGNVLLLFVIGVILQTLIVSRISVLGVTADLFLILTIVVAATRGSMAGSIFGFFAGLAADIAFMQPLGVRSLIYVLTGYLMGTVVLRFGSVRPWTVFLMSLGASFCAQFVFGIIQFVIGPRAGFVTILGLQILPQAILDALIAVPVFVLLVRLRVLPEPRTLPATGKTVPQ